MLYNAFDSRLYFYVDLYQILGIKCRQHRSLKKVSISFIKLLHVCTQC